ncbi:hypothetical protein PAPHI01_1133 [Pancytospora philotis]|nr:hypothetical protein PAPHI01_1133 [Pancytospora philotis]
MLAGEQERYEKALEILDNLRWPRRTKKGRATPSEITRLIHGFILFRRTWKSNEALHNSLLYAFFFVRNQDWLKNRRFLFAQCCKSPEVMAQCLRAVRTYSPLSTPFSFIMRQLQNMKVDQDKQVVDAAREVYDIEKARLEKLLASNLPLGTLTDRAILASFLNEEQLEPSLKKYKISAQGAALVQPACAAVPAPAQPASATVPAPARPAATEAASSKAKTAQSCSQAVPCQSPPEQFLSTPASSPPVTPANVAVNSAESTGQPTTLKAPSATAKLTSTASKPAQSAPVNTVDPQELLRRMKAGYLDTIMSINMIRVSLWPSWCNIDRPSISEIEGAVDALARSGDIFRVKFEGEPRVLCISTRIPKELREDAALLEFYLGLRMNFWSVSSHSFNVSDVMSALHPRSKNTPRIWHTVRSTLQSLVVMSMLTVKNPGVESEAYYFA